MVQRILLDRLHLPGSDLQPGTGGSEDNTAKLHESILTPNEDNDTWIFLLLFDA